MPKIYWMTGYNIREGKAKALKTYLNSKSFKKLCTELEKETGMKYVQTYFTIIPSSREAGDYDGYDLWELPNHAALDRIRKSEAIQRMVEGSYEFIEPKPSKSVILRSASDVRIIYEPKK